MNNIYCVLCKRPVWDHKENCKLSEKQKPATESNKRIIKEGDLIILTTGEYSDYSVHCICVALINIDIDIVKKEYIEEVKRIDGGKYFDYYEIGFMPWLVKKNYIQEVPHKEWHYQSYGLFESQDDDDYWLSSYE